MRILGRTWQILLKGLAEVRSSEQSLAAADMVLVRLTHAADLPSHEELVKQVKNGQNAPNLEAGNQASGGSTAAISSSQPTTHSSITHAPNHSAPVASGKNFGPRLAAVNASPEPALQSEESGENEAKTHVINGFEELIFLTEDKRDLKLKNFLRKHVRLVEMRSGFFEFNLEGNPAKEVLQYLKQKLDEWTGIRWNVVLSDKESLPTIDEIDRAEMGQKMENARSHPAVAAILKTFEGARIVDVRIREQGNDALPPVLPEDDEKESPNLDDFFE